MKTDDQLTGLALDEQCLVLESVAALMSLFYGQSGGGLSVEQLTAEIGGLPKHLQSVAGSLLSAELLDLKKPGLATNAAQR
jgi:hypothetical protein